MSQVHLEDKQAAKERYHEHIGDWAVAWLWQHCEVQRWHAWIRRKSLPDDNILANCEP